MENSLNHGHYICIEGLDGSGKSTLVDFLKERMDEADISFTVASPTKSTNPQAWSERIYRAMPILKKFSISRSVIYALRSKSVAQQTNWQCRVILGDRSVITSYVTRWRRWFNSVRLTVWFVNIMEPFIPAPSHVLFLELDPVIQRERLEQRGPLDIDETVERSEQMRKAYCEMRSSDLIQRLSNTQWHSVNAAQSPTQVADEAWNIILVLITDKTVEI